MAFYSAQIAAGSATAVNPAYQHMHFASVQGADATINASGDLQFTNKTLINSQLLFSMTVVNPTHFSGIFYQWDGGPILPLVPAFSNPGGVPIIINKTMLRTGTTLAFYANVDVASTTAWGIGFLTPTEEDTVFPPDGTQMTFTEQPSELIRVEAVISDGSYTSSSSNDLVPMPFSYVRFGPAAVDPLQNLQFSDIVIDDFPQLTITLQAASSAALNFIWGEWDYSGTVFLITTTNITSTGNFTIANIPIPPPNFQLEFANGGLKYGQGHYLQLFISCSAPVVFNWTNGRVFGIEASLVSAPVEPAPINPSVAGQTQPVIANSIQGGSFGPPIGPPLS